MYFYYCQAGNFMLVNNYFDRVNSAKNKLINEIITICIVYLIDFAIVCMVRYTEPIILLDNLYFHLSKIIFYNI